MISSDSIYRLILILLVWTYIYICIYNSCKYKYIYICVYIYIEFFIMWTPNLYFRWDFPLASQSPARQGSYHWDRPNRSNHSHHSKTIRIIRISVQDSSEDAADICAAVSAPLLIDSNVSNRPNDSDDSNVASDSIYKLLLILLIWTYIYIYIYKFMLM